MKKRGLADLWVVGKSLTMDDGKGPVELWLQKPNGNDHEFARRRADAARARILTLKAKPDSDEYMAAVGAGFEYADRDELIQVILNSKRNQITQLRTAEVGAEETWSEDSYLQGLRDAWLEGLNDTFAEDKDDPEANRVFGELKRFQEQVDAKVDAEIADKRESLEGISTEKLQEQVLGLHLRDTADLAWVTEFHKAQVWVAARDLENHAQRCFKERYEFDAIQDETLDQLRKELEELMVDPLEGKDSQETPSSSTSSEASDGEETEVSSGLAVVGL